MATSSRVHVIKSNLADQLALRAGLSGVAIYTAVPLSEAEGETEFIAFDGQDEISQEWGALGRLTREEIVTLNAFVWARRGGAGESIIRAVRARVVALFAEVEGYFVETKPQNRIAVAGVNTVDTSLCRATWLRESIDGEGRVAELGFQVRCTSRLTAT